MAYSYPPPAYVSSDEPPPAYNEQVGSFDYDDKACQLPESWFSSKQPLLPTFSSSTDKATTRPLPPYDGKGEYTFPPKNPLVLLAAVCATIAMIALLLMPLWVTTLL